jgi:hypothetical protein
MTVFGEWRPREHAKRGTQLQFPVLHPLRELPTAALRLVSPKYRPFGEAFLLVKKYDIELALLLLIECIIQNHRSVRAAH